MLVRIDAVAQEVVVQHEGREVKRQALKGVPSAQAQPFEDWVTRMPSTSGENAHKAGD